MRKPDFGHGIRSAWVYIIAAFLGGVFISLFFRAGFSYLEIASYFSLVGILILVYFLPKELKGIRLTLNRIDRKLGKERTDTSNPGSDNEKEEEEEEVKPSGGGAFGGMIVAGAIGTAIFGPVGTIVGGLIGAILGNQIEYESLKEKRRKK